MWPPTANRSISKPTAEVELGIADIATVHVRGGRREAQEIARNLEDRWSREVVPHLAAAGVTDLDGLDVKIAEAQELDCRHKGEGRRIGFAARPARGA